MCNKKLVLSAIIVVSMTVLASIIFFGMSAQPVYRTGGATSSVIISSNSVFKPDTQKSLSQTYGNTYYVSGNGNDGNSGKTPAGAFGNISYALSAVPPGSRIIIEPGIYVFNQPLIINKSVYLVSDSGKYWNSHVYLKAARNQINLNGRPASVFQLGGSPNPSSYTGNLVTNVTIKGLNFQGAGIEVPGTGAGYLTIAQNSFRNLYVEAIGYHGNPVGYSSPFPVDNFINIIGNQVYNVSGFPNSGMWLGNLQNSSIMYNTVENTSYAGIIMTGTTAGSSIGFEANNYIVGNRVANIPQQGIQIAFGSNVMVLGNTISHAGSGGTTVGKDAAISLFNPDQTNIVMEYNVLANSSEGLGVSQKGVSFSNNSLGSGIVFTHNDIIGNGIGVYNNAGSGTLNASDNWWGLHIYPVENESNGYAGSVNIGYVSHHPFNPESNNYAGMAPDETREISAKSRIM